MCQKKFKETGLGNWKNEVSHADELDGTYSGWYFTDSIQNVIHSLKYDERAKLEKELGFQLGILSLLEEIISVDALMHVPLHSGIKESEDLINLNGLQWV